MRDLDTRFAALNQQVTAAVRPPAPVEIVRRARRRTGIRTAIASIVAATALGGGAVFAVPGDEPTPRPTPSPSVSESSPAPTPSTTPSAPPASSPPAKAPRATQPVARDIPAGFLLYDETAGQDGWSPTDLPGSATICDPEKAPRSSTGRLLTRPYQPGRTSPYREELHVFSDEATARRAWEALNDEVPRCRRETFDHATIEWTARRIAIGDAALKLTAKQTNDDGSKVTHTTVFVRRGIAIAAYSSLDAGTTEADARLMAQRMCRYDSDCQPADGFPNPVPPKHGKKYWVTVLAVAARPVTDMSIGKSIAQASEVGYVAQRRDPSCDQGARDAMKLKPEKNYEYVAVYFASDSEAQQFMDRYEPPVLFMFEVKAMCRD